jgi:hypothetical protein
MTYLAQLVLDYINGRRTSAQIVVYSCASGDWQNPVFSPSCSIWMIPGTVETEI